MEMLEQLIFVSGAVSKKEIHPAMKHLQIKNGLVTAYNGELALSAPISINLECNPLASQMIKAISQSGDQIALSLNGAGNLKIVSDSFRVVIPCYPEPFIEVLPEGEIIEIDGKAFLNALKIIKPFINADNSKPWATGALFDKQSVFATNNVCLIEHWVKFDFPKRINVPGSAISEIVRINEVPEKLMVSDNNLTVIYTGRRWLRTQLIAYDWPDVSQFFNDNIVTTVFKPEFFESLAKIKPFLNDLHQVFIENGEIKTDQNDEIGASVKLNGISDTCSFSYDKLVLLKNIATHINFSTYPKPCYFKGEDLRGLIIGFSKK